MKRYCVRNPGPFKRRRWRTAMHEAGHAVAFSILCGQSARASVNRDGTGECRHTRVIADLRADGICIDAGRAAEVWDFYPMPSERPRGMRRRPGRRSSQSDAESLRLLARLDQSEFKLYGIRTNLPALGEIRDAADDFVLAHLDRILGVARVIFRRGVAFVPATKEHKGPASVRRGEVTVKPGLAACAAGQ